MGGAPEGGGPPRAAIQRGPCPKVPAEFDSPALVGASARRAVDRSSTLSREHVTTSQTLLCDLIALC